VAIPWLCGVLYPIGRFASQDEGFLEIVDTLMSREAAWATAQGFEAFESCRKDLLAAYYHAHPTTAENTVLQKHERSVERGGDRHGVE
jgi:hypothetical protein